MAANRVFSKFIDSESKKGLEDLLASTDSPLKYQRAMKSLGSLLGKIVNSKIPSNHKCLVASTAEDADFLSTAIIESISSSHETFAAVFWNNHYKLDGGVSVAPIVHKYIQPGYEASESLLVVKSIISSSCVVRSNLLELIGQLDPKTIYIMAPVMHVEAEDKLRDEFPPNVSCKFEFIYFAKDTNRDESTGNVLPGIGGQIYKLLGLEDQPVKKTFIPQLAQTLAFSGR